MIIHLLANANFTDYQYSEVYIPGGKTITLNGESITTVSDIKLPIGVNTTNGNSGDFFLIGKRKAESYRNVDGTYPIK